MKEKKPSVLKRLIPYSGGKAYMLNLAMVMSALSGVFVLMPLVFIHRIVSGIILSGEIASEMVVKNASFATGFAIAAFVLYTCALVVSHLFAFEVEHNIIKQNMEKMMNMPLGFFANRESGKIRKTIIDGAGQTHTFLAHQLPDFASTMISPIVLLIFFVIFDWRIGLVSLIPLAAGIYFMSTMMSKENQERRDEYFAAMAELSAESVEYIRGIPVVKTFAQSVESFERFHSSIKAASNLVMKMTLGWKNKMSLFEALSSATAFFVVPAAIMMISKGADMREILGNSVIYMLIGPTFSIFLMRTAYIQQFMYMAGLSLDKIEEILDYESFSYGQKNSDRDTIEFRNVSFSYGEDSVLNNISFKVNEGETVALVGASGSGKTTIARLAARFYDPSDGEILIGGINIRDYEKNTLMNKIAFVFQNSKLFKMSLKENMMLGNPNATEDHIAKALVDSGSVEIVDRLENGLDTIFGTKGTYFSGGEVQRLSIARAFLKDAGIIILDEATALADPENEKIIQDSFKKISEKKTTLMIAHRLSTIIGADKILVIDAGKIAESGTHDELLAQNGLYKKLWDEYQRAAKWKIGGGDHA
ncbi:MAG: ABC transporter ATP-binding protein [Peptostreptococcaceae bacterium]|nr:ABC transporter ATP-binding protein [Peptostreptococcaceae bacterium]